MRSPTGEAPMTRRHSSRKIVATAKAVEVTASAGGTPKTPQNGKAAVLATEEAVVAPTVTKVRTQPIVIPGGSKTTLGAGVKQLPGGGGIFKSAAVAVLRLERKLMSTGDITRVALERGLIKCQGKTPEATMASALYTDVKRKERKSIFTRPQEGLFGLQEWADEGFFPEPVILDATGVSSAHPDSAANSPPTANSPKSSKRTRSMTLRQRTDMRKPWVVEDDEDSKGTSRSGSPNQEPSTTPGEKSRSDYLMQELPGKQRLKNALRLQQELDSGMDTPDSSRSRSENPTRALDLGGTGEAPSAGRAVKKKPRLHVEVPGGGSAGIQQVSNSNLGGSAASIAWAMAVSQARSVSPHPELLNALDASRLIGSGGIAGMDPPGLANFLPTSLESGAAFMANCNSGQLRSPLDAAILGSLDTPALMSVPIPDGVPLTPEALAAAALRSGLTPRWGLTPRINPNGSSLYGCFSPGPFSARFPLPSSSSMGAGMNTQIIPTTDAPGFDQSDAPGDAAQVKPKFHPAMRASAAAAEVANSKFQMPTSIASVRDPSKTDGAVPEGNDGGDRIGGRTTFAADERASSRAGTTGQYGMGNLDEMQKRILALEVSLGCNHPQVGKAWLFFCRSAQAIGGKEAALRAEHALIRAHDICAACNKQTQSMSTAAEKSFSYLLDKVRNLSTTGSPPRNKLA